MTFSALPRSPADFFDKEKDGNSTELRAQYTKLCLGDLIREEASKKSFMFLFVA